PMVKTGLYSEHINHYNVLRTIEDMYALPYANNSANVTSIIDCWTTSPPPPSGITNGGFETGNFSGWTTTGTTSISSTAHTGVSSGQAGSTSPTNGDSTISQTFAAPTGTSALHFWYQVHCLDKVRHDWATAT